MAKPVGFATPSGYYLRSEFVTSRRGPSHCGVRRPTHVPANRSMKQARRLVSPPIACASALEPQTAAKTGSISVLPSASDVAVGDTLSIEYTPPAGLFDTSLDSKTLFYWAGGFRDWSGEAENETLTFPLIPLGDGRFRVSICIPEYANSVTFGFTDDSGFKWDTNNGDFFRICVKYQKRLNKDGKVEAFVADEDDASDSSGGGRDLQNLSASPPVLKEGEEDILHKVRGEAALVAEETGLGAIQVNQARDVFTRVDKDWKGTIPISSVGHALAELDFDLPQSRIDELVAKYVKDDHVATMTEFVLIYAELEAADEGINMI